ncbi:MAG: amidohydrolase family protein, partial [Burkholderiaceae bacterium]
VLEVFGPQRVLWGSDWPVLERAASYGRWWGDVSAQLDPLPEADRDAVLGGNARRTYRLSSAHDDRASVLNRS